MARFQSKPALLHQPCCTSPVAPTLSRDRVPYVQPERMFLLLNAYLENKPLLRPTKAQVSKG